MRYKSLIRCKGCSNQLTSFIPTAREDYLSMNKQSQKSQLLSTTAIKSYSAVTTSTQQPPESADPLSQAIALHEAGNLDSAETMYRTLLASTPKHANILKLLGTLLFERGNPEEGLQLIEKAIAIKPDYAEAHYDRGVALMNLAKYHDALESFEKTITFKPEFAEAYWNKSLLKLLLGEYLEGWELYEWRWKRNGQDSSARLFQKPLWTSNELQKNKTILIHAEQGFGDTLQFCRYIPMVARTHKVIFACFGALSSLMKYNFPEVEVVASDSPGINIIPEYDYHIPLMSLPHVFGTTLETVPFDSYLRAQPEFIKKWQRILNEKPDQSPRIGLCWAGKKRSDRAGCESIDARRSLHFKQIKPLLSIKNTSFVSLQLGPSNDEIDDEKVRNISAQLENWSDTAAVISLLDMVISVDTSVCHLAAAMGKKTFLLNRYDTCWRWLLDRDDSPWYPSLTQFRQKTSGDWTEVIERVKKALL